MSIMNDFEHLRIQLQDIRSTTNDFKDNPIGGGGFGKVYKGELSFPHGSCVVAIKCLDRKLGQGDIEFWKEIMMLSQYKHENLISLLRFCHEGPERILVYEYASRGSLDRYLGDTCLTWTQRLKICLGVAHGLNYLHDPKNNLERVLHRDVKSSNILLDDKWTAKLSDFGLSKYGPKNQQYTYLVSNVVGTPGYCDPLYFETGFLSKESDVYSFGVVLFEVMCGRLCFESCNGEQRFLVPVWKKCYDENRLNDITCHHLKEQVDVDSLITFSSIANQCLNRDRIKRPSMANIIKRLEMALDEQEMYEDVEQRIQFEENKKIADQAKIDLSCRSRKELKLLLSGGLFLNKGKTWFYQNGDGNNCEMISAKKCMFTYPSHQLWPHQVYCDSRFDHVGLRFSINSEFQLDVTTQFLSPHITYTINLVYDYEGTRLCSRVPFKYKFDNETKYSTSCISLKRKFKSHIPFGVHHRLVTELYQFTSTQKRHHFRIHFLNQSYQDHKYSIFLEGIEFRPMEYEKDEKLKNENSVAIRRPVRDFDIELEQKLNDDYVEIIMWSKYFVEWTTKKEVYYILRNGVLVNKNGEKWFSISKNMKKRYMQPWRETESIWASLIRRKRWIYKPLQGSRFDMVAECSNMRSFEVICEVESNLLSDGTKYACYLVYKLPPKHNTFEDLVRLDDKSNHGEQLIYLLTPPHIPIIRLNVHEEPLIPCRRVKGHPKLRKDGWMEIQLGEVLIDQSITETISLQYCLSSYGKKNFMGLLVQGIELRPAKVLFS